MAAGQYELVAIWKLAKIMRIPAETNCRYPGGGYFRLLSDIAEVLKTHDGELKLGPEMPAFSQPC